MIRLPISQEDIEWAKANTKQFDEQKTYNKLECNNNFLGVLGEFVLHKYMDELLIPHKWFEFVKKGWEEPDFNINSKSVDIKTTFDCKMWFQRAVFDYYVFARVNQDNLNELLVIGYIKGKKLKRLLELGRLELVMRANRTDYVCPISWMKPFDGFFQEVMR